MRLIGRPEGLSIPSKTKVNVVAVGHSQLWEHWKVRGRSAMGPYILWQNSNWLIVISLTMDVLVVGLTLHMTVTSAAMAIALRIHIRTQLKVVLAGHPRAM